ncbi:MAG TPA: RDD family protein [Acidimicrobiales bacterium]|nr:RDD family protein [Acidimicrobiales bacterium]
MSTTSQGEGWWQASDGNWYPPEAAGAPAAQPAPGPALAPGYFVPTTPCPRCGQPTVADRAGCDNCGQVKMLPIGVTYTTAGRRFGQYLLDGLLAIVTLGIGYLIWSLFIWRRGETPAMQILRIKVIKLETGEVATWGTMGLREFVGKWIVMGAISSVFFPAWVVLVFMLMWDKNKQELWDKIAGTIVVSNYPEPVEAGQPFAGAVPEQASEPVVPEQAAAPTVAEQAPQA